MLFLVSYGVFINASMILVEESTINYRLKPEKAEFRQGCGYNSKMFESVYNSTGVVSAFDNVGMQIKTMVITREKKEYKGEYFLKGGNGRIKKILFSPNKLVFKVNLSSEDTLIINQNYFSGWHSTQGKVIDCDGLLGFSFKKDRLN